MKNPLPVLLILFGIGALLIIGLIVPTAAIQVVLFPIISAIFISLGCLGSGIVLIIADRKYKLPDD